jgi:hypothetical protein
VRSVGAQNMNSITSDAIIVFLATVVLTAISAQPLWAQAQSVQVPTEQRELSNILSRYNELHDGAPNSIQRDRIDAQFRSDFCGKIPNGNVSGWIGTVDSIDDHTPDKGIRLRLGVNIFNLGSGPLGIELSLGNYYAYGVNSSNTQPHPPTIIPVGSPLYNAVANLRDGDVVRFSGTFVPYVSPQACYDNNTTYFALVGFTSIQRLGWDIRLR